MIAKLTHVVVIGCFLAVASFAAAHPGHLHAKKEKQSSSYERNWTLNSGDQIRGTFVAAQQEQVEIRRADDSLLALKLTDLSDVDQHWIERRQAEIRAANHRLAQAAVNSPANPLPGIEFPWNVVFQQSRTKSNQIDASTAPEMARAFEAFVQSKAIKTRWDDRFFYVESSGIPDHRMMVGITAWQQQVPLPQKYLGENAWQIPLNPIPAKTPATTKDRFLRGAIALAVNGVPIFNPLNNRGDDAFLFGELDEFGGHCGRADDYHYHLPPVHLEKTIGKGLPIAYALDGYPIYGFAEADGSKVMGLDKLNGHVDAQGNYHYHATKAYPYLNGGFYGEVTERGGQVDPQPRAEPLRPAGTPLRDAKITEFRETKPGSFHVVYDVRGKPGSVSYTIGDDGSAKFVYVDTNGKSTSESYTARRQPPGGERRPPPPPPPRRDEPTRRDDQPPPEKKASEKNATTERNDIPQLTVTSSGIDAKGYISAEYTCDGTSASPALEWKDAPAGTKSFAINLWHEPGPGSMKSYWVVYNIPADVTKIGKNDKTTGTLGLNDKRRAEYDPMCSKGPGVKHYHITVYALSAELKLPADKAERANLLTAIKDITLAEGTLDFMYERKR